MSCGCRTLLKCPICGKSLVEITPSHAKTHGLTKREILDMYPECKKGEFRFGKVYEEENKPVEPFVYHKSARKWYK
jgi:C4-type Zn-finger protein